jgi:hypothetical protein
MLHVWVDDDVYIQTISQSSSSPQHNCEAVIHDQGLRYDPYLAAGNARTERVVADTDFFIDDVVRKVVLAPSHRTDEHTDVVCFGQRG